MTYYRLFGGCLESELALAGLKPGELCSADWRLAVRETPPPDHAGTILGTSRVDEGVSVRLYRGGRGYRLNYDDTGVFDIDPTGSRIVWYRPPDANLEHAGLDVLGRVMAVALHASGDLCLHASAVLTPQGAIAFVAPKFHGKSTLAMALAHAGCPALTDDILPIGFADGGVFARPGVPRLRLWSDSARRLAPDRVEGHIGGKFTMDSIPTVRATESAFPLAALYLIAPRTADPTVDVVSRDPLNAVQAALALVGHTKTGELLGASQAPALLQRATCVAHQTPMYRLNIVRGYERIAEATGRIAAWHQIRPTSAAASA